LQVNSVNKISLYLTVYIRIVNMTYSAELKQLAGA
jgi:hypothetical protein